jgi:vacuolar-type H+-ATPase subunit H
MPTDGIRKVSEAEKTAEGMINAASTQADSIVSDGRAVASRTLTAAEGRAAAKAREIQEKARVEADTEIRAIEQAAEKERERFTCLAEMHREEAVRVVLEAIER